MWLSLSILAAALALAHVLVRPSNDRQWSPDQAVLPSARFEGSRVHVQGIRNFHYRGTYDYDQGWYDKTFDLDRLESLWFVVEPFGESEGAAHTLMSFGFAGPEYLAISVEIRKERGEEFSPWKGLLRRYELMYVIGDERDLIQLRSNIRRDPVYLYPIRAPRERIREMFVSMLTRANHLRAEPEFYNTLTNTCTTNIVRHVNEIAPGRVPWFSLKVLLPGYSDRLAYDLGLLDTDLPFGQVRERFRINERALRAAGRPDFSIRIRRTEPWTAGSS
jgi:hypothetical protein